jgi:hypothetical protein
LKKESWKRKIIDSCRQAGTYQPCFDTVIDTLALILERRDDANEQFVKSGGKPVIAYTNKGGATNPAKHPALIVWDDLNKTALQYWRDLGLTPSGLKRINEQAMAPRKRSALAEALRDLGEGL